MSAFDNTSTLLPHQIAVTGLSAALELSRILIKQDYTVAIQLDCDIDNNLETAVFIVAYEDNCGGNLDHQELRFAVITGEEQEKIVKFRRNMQYKELVDNHYGAANK